MSADSQSFDPYRSPTLPEGPYAGPPTTGRPGWLTALCVLCIVLGALGIANSAFGSIGLIAGRWVQQMMAAQPQAGMPEDMKEAQKKMQDELYAIQSKYMVPLVLNIILRVAVGALLLIGGIRCLGLHEAGRKLLIIACAVALLFDILQTILQSVMAMENMTVMHGFMEGMAGKTPGTPKEVEGIVRIASIVIRFLSLALIFVVALAKIGLYIFGLIYLRKPHIISRFQINQALTPVLTPGPSHT